MAHRKFEQRYKVWFHSWTQRWYVSTSFPADRPGMKRVPFITATTLDAAMNKLHARIKKNGANKAAVPDIIRWESKQDKRSRDFSKFIRSH